MQVLHNSFIIDELEHEPDSAELIDECNLEKLKSIFDIATTLPPKLIFTMGISYVCMIVDSVLDKEVHDDFSTKILKFIDDYCKDNIDDLLKAKLNIDRI